ncbi:hypothetical protein ACYSNR_03120 [Enterococcus sp. LJL128]
MKKKIIKALPDVALMVVSGLSFRASLLLGLLTVVVWATIGITNDLNKTTEGNSRKRKIIN